MVHFCFLLFVFTCNFLPLLSVSSPLLSVSSPLPPFPLPPSPLPLLSSGYSLQEGKVTIPRPFTCWRLRRVRDTASPGSAEHRLRFWHTGNHGDVWLCPLTMYVCRVLWNSCRLILSSWLQLTEQLLRQRKKLLVLKLFLYIHGTHSSFPSSLPPSLFSPFLFFLLLPPSLPSFIRLPWSKRLRPHPQSLQ